MEELESASKPPLIILVSLLIPSIPLSSQNVAIPFNTSSSLPLLNSSNQSPTTTTSSTMINPKIILISSQSYASH